MNYLKKAISKIISEFFEKKLYFSPPVVGGLSDQFRIQHHVERL